MVEDMVELLPIFVGKNCSKSKIVILNPTKNKDILVFTNERDIYFLQSK